MKKILFFVLLLCLVFNMTSYAYNFPQPDWGELLKERKNMVMETDFELYTQGPITSAPYYGARLEPRGGTYIGMIAETSNSFQPVGSYLTYLQNSLLDDIYYPANQMIRQDSVVAMVGWTIDDLGLVDYDHIRKTLNNLSTYNKPMFIRFANEMNCSSLGDDPERYKQIFRTVANMVHEYDNFAVVWSPIDLGALDRPFELYYPGDEYVDWVGVSCYSIKYFQGKKNTDYNSSVYFMTGDFAWATNRVKPIMEFMEKNNIQKPVMISEGGVPTNNHFDEWLAAWATPRLQNMLYNLVMKYPQIKMINYFNTYRNEAERFNISDYDYAANIFMQARDSGAYIKQEGTPADFVFQPANSGETLVAKDGVVPLYTLAHFPDTPDFTVNYYLDGAWYHAVSERPFMCNLNVSSLADGAHTIKISSLGVEKTYTFYKSGNSIRFGAQPDVPANPIVNTVLNTDIKAYIDGYPIRSYNIDGNTCVVVEDLMEYGFDVVYDNADRTLRISDARNPVTSSYVHVPNTNPVGSKAMDVYATDIVTYVKLPGTDIYENVDGQNVNGSTVIVIDKLQPFGNLNWDADARTISFSRY